MLWGLLRYDEMRFAGVGVLAVPHGSGEAIFLLLPLDIPGSQSTYLERCSNRSLRIQKLPGDQADVANTDNDAIRTTAAVFNRAAH